MAQLCNKRLALVLAIIGLALGAGTAQPAMSSGNPIAQAACTKATIGGQKKCIAAGQFCKRSNERDYNKYGYTCSKKDKNGRYHLKKQ